MVGGVLIVTGLLAGRYWEDLRRGITAILLILAFSGAFLVWRDEFKAPCDVESSYYCIRVDDITFQDKPTKALALDHLIHSYVRPEDPTFLGYEYEQIFMDITSYLAAERQRPVDMLFIGGGGYTFPRALEVQHPDYGLTVVEIDPQVTETAHKLGLNRDTKVVSLNEDGRYYFLRNGGQVKYDLIFGDAFNDLSVPYHLTTVEFSQMLKGAMKEGGIYSANIVDDARDGEFLQAFLNTQAQVFKYVNLFSIGGAFDTPGASTYVVTASDQPMDMERFQKAASDGGKRSIVGRAVADQRLADFMNRGRRLVLTDDFVPVDNLVAPILARSK
jgi:spermidine synthase